MSREDGGWWSAAMAATSGSDYAFSIDGGPARPDPRSPSQPAGPHGASRVVDHAAFRWTDQAWRPPPFADGVLYEMHIGTFSPEGTFDGARSRLDALAGLGITHVEVMPIAEGPGRRGWGYDGVDLFAPHHAYGGPDGFKRFVNACHARGLAVLLDVVYNHFGPAGNYVAEFGPYFTERYRTPWGVAVNLDDRGSDEVRRFFCDNAVQWIRDYHCDGLRLDAVHALYDASAKPFLEELAGVVATLAGELRRELVLVAESDLNDPRILRAPEAGGYGLRAQWSDDFHHALHVALTRERMGYYEDFGSFSDLAKALRDAYVYDGRYSPHRGRRHGRPADGLAGDRFVGYAQNHDQVGNRARGDRSSHLLSTGRLKIAAALVLTAPFVPLLFQGEEWGTRAPFPYFTDHDDPALGEAVRNGRRRELAPFGWTPEDIPDPQAESTFAMARLDWDERGREPHASLLAWHRDLIALRRETPTLRNGERSAVKVDFDDAQQWIVVARGPIRVACHLGVAPRTLRLDHPGQVRLASEPGVRTEGRNLLLPPDSVAILEVDG